MLASTYSPLAGVRHVRLEARPHHFHDDLRRHVRVDTEAAVDDAAAALASPPDASNAANQHVDELAPLAAIGHEQRREQRARLRAVQVERAERAPGRDAAAHLIDYNAALRVPRCR